MQLRCSEMELHGNVGAVSIPFKSFSKVISAEVSLDRTYDQSFQLEKKITKKITSILKIMSIITYRFCFWTKKCVLIVSRKIIPKSKRCSSWYANKLIRKQNSKLLNFLHNTWSHDESPASWRLVTVILYKKPNKDAHEPTSFRTIFSNHYPW